MPLELFYFIRQRMRLVLNMSTKEKETGGIKKDWTGIRRMWRKSIDTNVLGMMPNGDPAPKRDPKDKKRIIKSWEKK